MIEIRNLSKTFENGESRVEALKNINITIPDGDIFGIIGMSGAGKSTLVRTINMLERPTSGEVIVNGVNMNELSSARLREERRKITMIFQGFNLLMQRTCLKNVCFPLELQGVKKSESRTRALELLKLVGLEDKADSYPSRLSGGQQQRVAIARALATDPDVLLCDEATSALDPQTTNSILDLIREINEKLKITVIVITHQMSVVENICRHVAIIEDGSVVESGSVEEVFASPKSAAGKRLVFPESDAEELFEYGVKGQRILRVVFNGDDSAYTPVIAEMAADTGIHANICYASTRTVNGKAYGSMLLSFQAGDDSIEEAVRYLGRFENIFVEEVTGNVQ